MYVNTKKTFFSISLLLGLVLLTFLPRILTLSKHWASDEDLWMERSHIFFSAMQSGKFSDTFPTFHPGVTTMWLGSLALWSTYLSDSPIQSEATFEDFSTPDMLALIRFPIAFVTGVLILLAGFCVYRLFGGTVAALSTAFLAVEPFLLSESRRAHTDALTALFLCLSLLLWLCYLEDKLPRRRDIVLSGISFALACLTKSHASAFILFVPILLGWYFKQRNLSVKFLLWNMLLWMMVVLLTVLVVFPYMWTRPHSLFLSAAGGILLVLSWRNSSKDALTLRIHITLEVLLGLLGIVVGFSIAVGVPIVNGILWALTESHEVPQLFLGESRHDPGWLYFTIMWGVWSGLLTLPLIGFAIYGAWCQHNLKDDKTFRITVVLLMFVLFYLFSLSIVSKKISRYLVIFLPAVSLLTALGVMNITQRFSKKWIGYVFFFVIFVLQAFPVLHLHPYYRAYYHPLLSGTWVAKNTTCITGIGLDIAADYLNAKPDAKTLQVRLTWFCKDLEHYFVGDAFPREKQSETTTTRDFDYDIEYLSDKQLTEIVPMDASEDYQPHHFLLPGTKLSRDPKPEHVVRLNGIDYVWIYRLLKSSPTVDTEAPRQTGKTVK